MQKREKIVGSGMEWLVEAYLQELEKVRDPKTVRTKEYLLNHLLEYTDGLIDFSRSNLIEFYDFLQRKGLKESTIRSVFGQVRQFYRWLSKRGYAVEFDDDTVKDIYLARRKQVKRVKKYYSDDELNLILRAIRGEIIEAKNPVYYLLVTFLTSSGLRIAEAVRVRKKDIRVKRVLTEDGEEKEVWVVHVREGKFGKEREAPIVFFKPEWKVLWEKWLERLNPEDHIFTYSIRYPKSVKTIVMKEEGAKKFFWRLEKELREQGFDIGINAHRFRYTYITKLATMGLPVNLIADWAGHSKISTTLDIYMQAEREMALNTLVNKWGGA